MKKSPATRISELAEQAAETLPQDDALRQISELVERAECAATDIALAEIALDAKKYELREIAEDLLPCAMQEVGIEEFTTTTGRKVRLQTVYSGTIGKGRNESNEDHATRRAEALYWLKHNLHDGIIKTKISVALPRGESGMANSIRVVILERFGVELDVREDIHPQTLKSFVREQMQGDFEDFPHALFRASSHVRANIKQEK
ncbi:MAG: hypothetical protein V3S55_07820 [Nitrospiraceae bacterium]